MAAWGYEFYLRVLKVSLTSERSERVRYTFSTQDKILIPKRPFNILYFDNSLEIRTEILRLFILCHSCLYLYFKLARCFQSCFCILFLSQFTGT